MKESFRSKILSFINKELLFGIVIGLILSSTAVFAVIKYSSTNVFYKNVNSNLSATTLKQAIDELYRECTNRAYTLTVDSKGGVIPATTGYTINGSIATKSVTFNGTYGTLPTPTKEGYGFDGWYTQETGGTKVTSDTKYRINGNSTIYAHWNKSSYTISYTLNNGTNNSNNPTSYNVESDAITLQAPSKTLTFKGNANSTSGANAASGSVTIGANTTKAQTFAGWTGSNGSTNQTSVTIAKGSTGNKSYTAHWTAVAGTLPTVTRAGYTCGWNTSSSGTTITYASGGTFPTSAISESMGSTVNLYAVCTRNTYSISYTLNNGTNNSNNPTSYNIESNEITLQAPSKTLTFKGNANSTSGANAASGSVTIGANTTKAQTFAGWTGSNGSTNQTSVTIAKGSTGNKSYTAHWTAVAGTLPTVTRAGYTCGWNTSSSGTTITYASGGTFPTSAISESMGSTVNLYAVCTRNTYSISYTLNNGTNNSNNPTSYNIESNEITLQAPSKTLTFKGNANSTSGANAASGSVTIGANTTKAQTFAGWTGSNGSTNQTSVTIAKGSTGNKSYTAHWTAVAGTLPTVTRAGYTCGWNTSSSGTTITYASGGTFPTSAISESMGSTVNLYAVCKPNTYTGTFYYQSNTTSGSTTVSSKTVSCTVSSGSNCSVTIPSEVRSSGGTYNNAYAGLSASTGNMTEAVSSSSTTVTLSSNKSYYSLYRTTINIYYPTSTSATTSKAVYQNQWLSSTSAMATTVLSTSTTGTSTNASEGALVSGYSLIGFNASASQNSATWSSIDALTKSDSNRTATRSVYQIEKKTETKTATFYYNNNTTCGGTTVATKTASGTQTIFLRPTSTSAAGTSVSNVSLTVPSEVTASKGPYNGSYVNVASAVNSMSAATVNTGTLTYYAFYRSNVTRYYASSTTATTSDTLYRNEVFTSTSAMKTVLATTNTGTSTNAAAKLAVSGYSTLVGFNTSASQNTQNSGATIGALATTCNTTVYEIDKKTETKTATFYYQSSATSGTCSVTSATATGTQTTFLRPTSTTAAGTSLSNGNITVPSAVSGSVGQYNNAYAGVATAVNSMTSATPNTGTLTYYAFYRANVTVYRPSSESATTSQQYYRNMALSSTSACGTTYLSTSNTGLSNTTPTLVSGYSFSSLRTAVNNGGTAYSVANAAKTNTTTFYVTETKSVTATYYYQSSATNETCSVASTTASGTKSLYPTSTTAATISNGAITVPSAVSGSVGQYNNAYAGVATGVNSMTAATSNTANTTYYAFYRTNVTVYRPSSESATTSQQFYRNMALSSTSACGTTYLSTSNTGLSNTTPTLVSGYSFSSLRTAVNNGGTAYSVANAAKINTTTFYVTETKNVTATYYYQSNTTSGTCSVTSTTASGTRTLYPSSTSAAATSNGSITIPSAVSNSVGQYNNAYAGVATGVNSMTAATSNTANTTYYAFYRTNVTVYRPSSESATTSQQYYRNMALSSTSACGTTYLSTSTTGLSNTTPTLVSGYSFSSLRTAVNNGGTSYTVANAANTNTTTFYVTETKSVTATYYYQSNTTSGTCSVTSTTASGTRTLYPSSTSAAVVSNGAITVPSAVSGSIGQYNNAYAGVATSTGSMTSATSNTANTTYYAFYRTNVTNYYWNSSKYSSRTLYRNMALSSTSACGTTYLSTSNTGLSNYSTAVGPGSSAWQGLSTGNDTTAEYTSVAGAAASNSTTLYSVYQMNVTYSKGSNVSSIGATSGSCKLVSSATANATTPNSCNVTLPSITANTGATVVGWNTTSGATTGTAVGSSYTLTSNSKTLYGNAKLNTYSVTYNAGGTCTGATGLPSAQEKKYGVDLKLTSTEPTCSGKAFLGWSTTSSATDTSTWYDGGTSYTSNAGLTLYAQFYDVDSLEKTYTTFLQSGDLNDSDSTGSDTSVTGGNAGAHNHTIPTKSGWTFKAVSSFDASTQIHIRTYQVSSGSVGIRHLVPASLTSSPTGGTYVHLLYAYNRTATTYSDSIDYRIRRLLQTRAVAIKYSEIKVKSNTEDNISNFSDADLCVRSSISDEIVTYAGFNLANASSNGTMVSRCGISHIDWYAESRKFYFHKSVKSVKPKIKITTYGLMVPGKNSQGVTFNPTSNKGLERYKALIDLNSTKSDYFPASYIKVSSKISGSTVTTTAWGSGTASKSLSIPNGKILGLVHFGVSNGTNGSNCSYASIAKAYISGVNTTSGTFNMTFYGGNKDYNTTSGKALTKVYGWGYALYLSSGSMTIS